MKLSDSGLYDKIVLKVIKGTKNQESKIPGHFSLLPFEVMEEDLWRLFMLFFPFYTLWLEVLSRYLKLMTL